MSRKKLCVAVLTVVAMLCFSRPADAGDAYLYPQAGPQGDPIEITGDVPDVSQLTSAPIMAIRFTRGAWVICTKPNYEGDCLFSMPGYLRNMQDTPLGPHVASLHNVGRVHSYKWGMQQPVRIPPDADFRHSLGLGGPNKERVAIAVDIPDLNAAGITFPIVAVGIQDRRFGWQLCSEVNYAGTCIYMVDDIPDLPAVFGWQVMSVRNLRSGATSLREVRGVELAAVGK